MKIGNLNLTLKFLRMQKKSFWLPLSTGILGILIGAIAMWVIIRISQGQYLTIKSCSPTITATQVHDYMKAFASNDARPFNDTLKGFTVDLQQYYAMQCLLSKNSSLKGFRIIFGDDKINKFMTIIDGVDSSGRDDKTLFYNVLPGTSGPCPPICYKE